MRRSRADAQVATLAITLAGILALQSTAILLDRGAAVSKFRLAEWLQPSAARAVVTVVALLGIVAGGLLLAPRTRVLGATAAATGFLLVAGHLVVVWSLGDPVQCLCSSASPSRNWLAHVEVVVVVVSFGLICAFVGWASRRPRRGRSEVPESARRR